MKVTLSKATHVIDTVIRTYSSQWYFLPGTREKAIECLWNSTSYQAAVEGVEKIVSGGKVSWINDDPCDEWKGIWFERFDRSPKTSE